ncbi:transposase [Xanthomonas cucurbitae]|uniref:Uncharacterized protein n=1 Tax=Xanthomonas cucurbitae TaxID=56453 RepID=A0A2S7DQ19_9XANT|nr:hypothetical protein XcuCFBP2542_12065 [Xanthomonas cucurbitae]QHG85922.1 hypothetical protein EBN15_01960 [Xanthomonas cucurbitae]WDM77230.1 transposase [Xanthomonas cucurbitae]WDM80880.1 transposase [Xanthomonas cucurbitae]WDM84576.1 transposase [Xanthomonas cucurbitae]
MVLALQHAETGTTVEEICCKMGISQATLYAWRRKFGGLGVAELRQLRQPRKEKRKLKQRVADLSLDEVALHDLLSRKWFIAGSCGCLEALGAALSLGHRPFPAPQRVERPVPNS